ncbi:MULTISPECIES: hypothetical protein [unclassified Ruegeria]|uniref:hypothetical protein n=1 Tax=unclassified Ruegeria TaxID=2625375 RepID=UPI001491CBAB|nr:MULTISPECIES: hypothetical protein [unclassified Ruegeria]NOD87422.1 hypothetical protein [Ruegeria sp. HKCCD4318]NOE12977.1 hypothetical protein [Ruegeria sp. HKCCD4318-2]NOG08856.1 hypothetical protein [Ruegeria sp. HKCCD4315]
MTPRKKRQPRKPQIDRDAAARAVQRQLGRPLTWLEYCRVWNEATKAMGRKDFLTGEVK